VPKTEHPEMRHNRRILEYWNLVSATAEYRFRICWRGARKLMATMGYDPRSTVMATCDQGDDVHARFILPDGTAVGCDFRDDRETRQAVSVTRWEVFDDPSAVEDEFTLAAELLQDEALKAAFDQSVEAFFEFHWRRIDKPLPPARP